MTELPTYYTNINQTLLESIPTQAPRVLEIGCGAGPLGGYYRSKVNPDCEYWGVEYVPEAAEQAKKVLSRVITGSIEDEAIYRQLPEDYFDVLIFGDVLEHLREPWDVLKRLAKHMRPGGQCIACIPNSQHWSFFVNYLDGKWEYQDSGLMDRTHLRFFTRKSMVSLFDENGWKVVGQQPRIFPNKSAAPVVSEIFRARDHLGLKEPVDEREFHALQWVFTANVTKSAQEAKVLPQTEIKLNICAFTEHFMDVRVRLPARDLAKIEGVEVISSVKQINIGELRTFPGPKVVVVQRPRITDIKMWFGLLDQMKKNDCVLVYELDDHPDLLRPLEGVDRKLLAQSAPATQTSTEKLASFFRTVNPETMWFGNCCHDLPIFRTAFFEGKPIVFYGALNREAYSPEIARRINPVLEKHDAGCLVVADKAFFEVLSISNKSFHQALDYKNYLKAMRSCQIMLNPLEGQPGEEYKSDVKFVEASSQGLATIASPLVYGETITDGENGIIAQHLDEWPERLDQLLSSAQERRRIANNAWNYIRSERLFAEQAPSRIQWYLELWHRRRELWAEAEKRAKDLQD
ncbi:methyltransferase domain-containing protein [Labrenzia sp. CE80]|uniref:methyltransferase domain-containing protein n=1 Tax=Labrenzia sp. CE80 TaxID=1788986 RepID=UPI00129BC5C3|nr:methyltransferase domain-containing protein [Labrenzia sp. CE80]